MNLICTVLAFLVNYAFTADTDGPFGPRSVGSPQQPIDLVFGDMMLTEAQKKALKSGEDMGITKGHGYAAVNDNNLRWTNAVIPYEIDCSLENMQSAIDAVTEAMKEWENKTCIRFVKRTNERKFLTFFRNTHCWGHVGMIDGAKISVGDGCDYQHVMTHEIGHVVGFYHEQNRNDRDNWVTVHWENIGQFKDAFDIVKNTDSLGVNYDYESIMHYPWNAFSSNGKNTMSPKRNTNGKVPYVALSDGDAQQTSLMYNCPKIIKMRQAARSKRHVDELNVDKRAVCVDKNKNCADWARVGQCTKSAYVQENCKLSCKSPSCAHTGRCYDKRTSCQAWARDGHCQGNSATVQSLCPLSCGLCKNPCIDEYADCAIWAKNNHCQLNPTVTKYCQRSCYPQCQGPTTQPPFTQPPVTQPPVTQPPQTRPPVTGPTPKPKRNFLGKGQLCIDYSPRCPNYAKQNRCGNSWEKRNCLKSCKSNTCDMGVQKPPGSCANPLGLSWDGTSNFKIPDSAFSSPGHLSPGSGWNAAARNARLYFNDDHDKRRIGAWCAKSHNQAEGKDGYVQVDLGMKKTVQYIATQGRDRYFERVSKFKIAYSDDGTTFQTYTEGGSEKVFDGNCDHFTPVLNKFNTKIHARYMRFIPIEWNYPCVRMEFYGC